MKKLIFSILFMVAVMFAANAQTNFNAGAYADSSGAAYVKATIGGGPGTLTIQTIITKVANTGTTVAGYAILQGSLDDTNYVNIPTWKLINENNVATSVTSFTIRDTTIINTTRKNILAVDTFTLANTTAAQPYIWAVTSQPGDCAPYYYYRVKIVMTTTTALCRAKYVFRKRI